MAAATSPGPALKLLPGLTRKPWTCPASNRASAGSLHPHPVHLPGIHVKTSPAILLRTLPWNHGPSGPATGLCRGWGPVYLTPGPSLTTALLPAVGSSPSPIPGGAAGRPSLPGRLSPPRRLSPGPLEASPPLLTHHLPTGLPPALGGIDLSSSICRQTPASSPPVSSMQWTLQGCLRSWNGPWEGEALSTHCGQMNAQFW